MTKSRSWFGMLLVPFAVVGLALLALSPRVSAAPPTIGWSSAINLSNTAGKSVYPAVARDAAGTIHVAWLDYTGSGSTVYYTNNAGGQFRAPFRVAGDGGQNRDQILAITTEANRVHILYMTQGQAMRHVVVNGGNPSIAGATTITPSGVRAFSPSLIVDAAGRVHAAWIDDRAGDEQPKEVYHRIWSGGWEDTTRRVRRTGNGQNLPSLAATLDGRVHVVFGDDAKTVAYSVFDGQNWQASNNVATEPKVNNQQLTTDGTNLYVAWSVSPGGTSPHIVYYSDGANGSWRNKIQVSQSGASSDFPEIVFSPQTRKSYVAFSANNRINVREITPGGGMSDLVVIGNGAWPNGSTGPSTPAFVWHDKGSGAEEVRLSIGGAGNVAPPPPPPPPVNATPTRVPPTPTPKVTATPKPGATQAPNPNAPATGTFDFASNAYADLWNRTDSLVKQNAVPYSWIWGPTAFTQGFGEYYVQSPGGSRYVQYFDKSRMEINQPDAPRNQWYVSNGRLADELITGQMQVGDAQYEQRQPAGISVVGDADNTFPYYRDFRAIYRRARASGQANEEMYRAPDGSVQLKPVPSANTDPAMTIAQRVNGIGVPNVFWSFMNRSGQAIENGQRVTANPLFDWRYVIGEPLTEAYWTYVKVNGQYTGVLVQAFERRVLTYTPANPAQFQVEMGNIGRHYFEWRYGVRPR